MEEIVQQSVFLIGVDGQIVVVVTDSLSVPMHLRQREAQLQKVPYMLVVGDREEAGSRVVVRRRSRREQTSMGIEEFADMVLGEAKSKVLGDTSERTKLRGGDGDRDTSQDEQ